MTDQEIETYWREELSAADERRVEQHYLECDPCRDRVHAVEKQRTSGKGGGSHTGWWRWPAAAAAMLAVVVSLGWQQDWFGLSAGDSGAPTTSAEGTRLALVHLSPPTRDGAVTTVDAASPSLILFVLDAREAGGAGTTFNVTLSEASGRPILRENGLRSTVDGEVRVPVDAALLNAGAHVLELTGGAVPIGFPFVVRR